LIDHLSGRFLDMAGERLNNEESMSVRAGGAEDMFLDVKDLAVRKLPIRKSYAPGSIDTRRRRPSRSSLWK